MVGSMKEAMVGRMKGKVALVTGAAGGIGAAAAELLCAHGARVVLVDVDADALVARRQAIASRLPGCAVETCAGDVANPDDAAKCVARATAAFGSLDTLVSNAAIRYLETIARADIAQWQKLVSVNVIGAVNVARAALPALRRSKGASIVLVSSTYALVGRKNFGAYDATKAALLSLMRTLAWEEAEHGVRVNAVCPGGTLTPFTINRASARGITEDVLRAEPKPDTLLRRWAEQAEIAYPILWLASDEASFVTGATLMVDGGTSIM
jgi:meso-butanediol dehydrogenase/(S,S)-butanediol dehydrogenase/diacetyl reductase